MITKIYSDRISRLIIVPFAVASFVYFMGYVYASHPEWVVSNIQQYSYTEFIDEYGVPFRELAIILGILGVLALFIHKNIYKYWLAVFGVWLSATLWWMLSIPYPRGTWENHRSAAADLSGAAFLLGTLVWLAIHYLIAREKQQK